MPSICSWQGEQVSPIEYAPTWVWLFSATSTIGLADGLGFPVSTTHVLSSAVAGTMLANRSVVQLDSIKKIARGLGVDTSGHRRARRRRLFPTPSGAGPGLTVLTAIRARDKLAAEGTALGQTNRRRQKIDRSRKFDDNQGWTWRCK